MSKKRTKKNKEKKQEIIPLLPEKTTLSKKEQIAKMLFVDFLQNTMKIRQKIENEFVSIFPYVEDGTDETENISEILCYEIISSSNKKISVFVDDTDIYAMSENKVVNLDDDEIAYLSANILGYIRKHVVI